MVGHIVGGAAELCCSKYCFHIRFRGGCNELGFQNHASAEKAATTIGMDPCNGQNSEGKSVLYIVIVVYFYSTFITKLFFCRK
jgi:hypothetical protein